jgi:hypothetical protein
MASIEIRDLQPAGHNLFADSESYLTEFSSESEAESEMVRIRGGLLSLLPLITLGLFTEFY